MVNDIWDDFEYAKNCVPDRFYISKRFPQYKTGKASRFARRIFSERAMSDGIVEKGQLVLRETATGMQQVKAKFLEDGRGISHLWLQRWNTKTGNPIGEQVILYDDEIPKLLEFLNGVSKVQLEGDEKFNRDFDEYKLVHLPDQSARNILTQHPELVSEFARNSITSGDIIALAYRRNELKLFAEMLTDRSLLEKDWQKFFEKNPWIFGFGLAYVFTTGLEGKTLSGAVRGASRIKAGKVPDAILKTRAAISALCLVEIKLSSTTLLTDKSYRSGTWPPTKELSGAVAQAQENVRAAVEEFGDYQHLSDMEGSLTGEELTAVQPQSFLVIGNLAEFKGEHGINVSRYRSFEGYRRNLKQPEILTFDELHERARFIVEGEINAKNENIVEED